MILNCSATNVDKLMWLRRKEKSEFLTVLEFTKESGFHLRTVSDSASGYIEQIISKMNMTKADGGIYACSSGSDTKELLVRLLEIRPHFRDIYIVDKQPLLLSCSIEVFDSKNVSIYTRWVYNNRLIRNTTSSVMTMADGVSTLAINNPASNDVGEYKCQFYISTRIVHMFEETIIVHTESDKCLSQPCANGGSCIAHESDYVCLCRAGYTGHICNELVNEEVELGNKRTLLWIAPGVVLFLIILMMAYLWCCKAQTLQAIPLSPSSSNTTIPERGQHAKIPLNASGSTRQSLGPSSRTTQHSLATTPQKVSCSTIKSLRSSSRNSQRSSATTTQNVSLSTRKSKCPSSQNRQRSSATTTQKVSLSTGKSRSTHKKKKRRQPQDSRVPN